MGTYDPIKSLLRTHLEDVGVLGCVCVCVCVFAFVFALACSRFCLMPIVCVLGFLIPH